MLYGGAMEEQRDQTQNFMCLCHFFAVLWETANDAF